MTETEAKTKQWNPGEGLLPIQRVQCYAHELSDLYGLPVMICVGTEITVRVFPHVTRAHQ